MALLKKFIEGFCNFQSLRENIRENPRCKLSFKRNFWGLKHMVLMRKYSFCLRRISQFKWSELLFPAWPRQRTSNHRHRLTDVWQSQFGKCSGRGNPCIFCWSFKSNQSRLESSLGFTDVSKFTITILKKYISTITLHHLNRD